MNLDNARSGQSVQQLVRYEALFTLLDEIQPQEDVLSIAQAVARRWKYFSNVVCWRLVIADDQEFQVLDGFRGNAQLTKSVGLSDWDAHFWQVNHPQLLRVDNALTPTPPPQFTLSGLTEIEVIPYGQAKQAPTALLTVAARHEPFNELDKRFIHLFGRYFVDRISGILLRKAALASLTHRATYDTVTNLYQRAVVIDLLCNQLIHCQRVGHPLSVIIADVDFFKRINDSYGHLAGDEVLQEIGRRFIAGARRGEIVGRYGGEEFLLVMYPCSRQESAEAAERFRQLITGEPFTLSTCNNAQVNLTISLGVFSTDGNTHYQLEEVLQKADQALYQAKQFGRDRAVHGNGE